MNSESHNFQTLLEETGIEFTPPPGCEPCPVRDNSVFRYQYALRAPSGHMEYRYRVDSFARLVAERKVLSAGMEMLSSVDINRMYTANYLSILHNLSGGVFDAPRVFSPQSAAVLYGADWSALCFLRLAGNDFAEGYDSAYVLALHKKEVADVYAITLFANGGGEALPFGKDNPVPALRFI